MQEAYPKMYRIGSLREFADWTRQVVRDPAAAEGMPKTWYDNDPKLRERRRVEDYQGEVDASDRGSS